MPLCLIGALDLTAPLQAAVRVIGGGLSAAYLVQSAQAHEAAGFDFVRLCDTPDPTGRAADALVAAGHLAARTARLGFLVTYRPDRLDPVPAARAFASFDRLWQGRLALEPVPPAIPDSSGARRWAAEHADVLRRLWTGNAPLAMDGAFISLRNALCELRPWSRPHPPLFLDAAAGDEAALAADFAILPYQPPQRLLQRIDALDLEALRARRSIRHAVSLPVDAAPPAELARDLLSCYRLGVRTALLHGYDPLSGPAELARTLLPRLRAGAVAIDAELRGAGLMLPGM